MISVDLLLDVYELFKEIIFIIYIEDNAITI